jgi:CDP-diacylglycerol--glycerol-3-phosphate 3-phosphatidyltransferase
VTNWLRIAYRCARVVAAPRARWITPSVVTLCGLLLSLGLPVTAAAGGLWLLVGLALVVLSALADSVDGALAVITRRASRLGHVLDSVADRISEAAWGVALWLLGAPAVVAVVAVGCGWLHEYVRARATIAGMSDIGTVTVAERPTRVIMVAATLLVAGLAGLVWPALVAPVATAAGAVWCGLALVGLAQLWGAVRRALT